LHKSYDSLFSGFEFGTQEDSTILPPEISDRIFVPRLEKFCRFGRLPGQK